MTFLLFQLGRDRYALEAAQVAEVMPLLQIKRIPNAPPGVAGVISYRGSPVPVIDLCEMALGTPAARRLSTRLVLVHYPDENGSLRLLGLIAEYATEILRQDIKDFADPGIASPDSAYLGPVTSDSRGMIQKIEVPSLLSAAVKELLFRQPVEA